jgi:hypothetical protein
MTRRILLLVTLALILAFMVALSGPALANHGAAHGSGGGDHFKFQFFEFSFNFAFGGGGSDVGGGGGGGGCITNLSTGERSCGGSGSGGTL